MRIDRIAPGLPWRELTWLLVLKFAALYLLWFLFFSQSHRSLVNSETTHWHFALDATPRTIAPDPYRSQESAVAARNGEEP